MTSMLFRIVRTCGSLFKWNYIKNKNFSVSFLFNLWSLYQYLKIFLKKKIVIANVFPKLQTVKHLVWHLSKKRCFKTSINSQHVKRSQTLKKSAWGHFYHIFLSFWGEMIWERSLLLKFEIIGVFVNSLTAAYKYPVPDCKNLLFAIITQFS